jgi:dihydrofolate reductase
LTFGDEFPYKNKEVYVFTRNLRFTKDNNVSFISENIAGFVENLKKSNNSNIWLVGGAEIITCLIENELVDEIRLFTMPVILQSGISLINALSYDKKLKLIDTKSYNNGVLESNYAIVY